MFYKMVHGLVDINRDSYAVRSSRSTRGNNLKFQTQRWNIAAWRDSFFPATIRDWNQLPIHVVNIPSLDIFKSNIKDYFEQRERSLK